MPTRLKDKVAIITGAGSVGPGWGNGRAESVIFAQEGASIVAVDRNPEALAETVTMIYDAGGEVTPIEADVTDSESVARMVRQATAAYGRIDVLVNNIGGSAPGGPTDLDEEAWHRQIDFNLTSVYLTMRHVVPVMRRTGGGSIVNTSSTSGIRFTGAHQVGYAASKAAVIHLSRVTAVEYAPDNIRVNTVIPGQLETPMVKARLARQRAGGDVDALLAARLARIPLGFAGDGRDTAYAALFLASDESRFVTGTHIVVDGGMSARCD
jgi:NAD(P)-dependent dehydrogenase (short-subunit alcohol dehydrogenase family)